VREPKASWVLALRALTGNEFDEIRWNTALGLWEFRLAGADGIQRSQFYGHFDKPVDPATGLHPFRELDDDGMRVVLANLESSFIGNRVHQSDTTEKELRKRMRALKAEGQKRYKAAGEAFADMASERAHRLRGAGFSGSGGTVAGRARRIEIVTPLGAK
jgi:hypothetical protein